MRSEPSQLDRFLLQQAEEGRRESEGAFTLARDKALEKIAKFQLPFAYAWTVKLVQWAVASRPIGGIRVDLTSRELRFSFHGADLDLDQLEKEFFTPERKADRAMNHLTAALWAIGLGEKMSFLLTLADQAQALMWDGERLRRVENSEAADGRVCLTVGTCTEKSGAMGWIKNMARSGKRNAEMGSVISKHCFTCPFPLVVDGLRVDSYYNCPGQSLTPEDIPLGLSFLAGVPPSLPTPPGTAAGFKLPNRLLGQLSLKSMPDDTEYDDVVNRMIKRLAFEESCELAVLPTVHRDRVKGESGMRWEFRRERSRLIWVQDGVVLEETPILRAPCAISMAVFVSADGLETDLTTLKLSQSEERKRRQAQAFRVLAMELPKDKRLKEACEGSTKAARFKGRVASAAVLGAGAFGGLLGVFPVMGVCTVIGGVGLLISGLDARNRNSHLHDHYDQLLQMVREASR